MYFPNKRLLGKYNFGMHQCVKKIKYIEVKLSLLKLP